MLKYILHGGNIEISNYITLYLKTTNAVATTFGTVMIVVFHNTSNQQSWKYMACRNCSKSSAPSSLVSCTV